MHRSGPCGPVLALVIGLVAAARAAASSVRIQAFPLSDVTLAPGSEFLANHEQNNRFLLVLDPNNLLYNFRVTAGLPADGEPPGGWEDAGVEVRGQFVGHYMSALASAAQSTGRQEFTDRGSLIVSELKKVQEAFGNGYLSAFPESHFDRLEALQPVWAPYYVIHKLMAGLLDQHQLAGNEEALPVLERMVNYFCGRVQRVLDRNGTDAWHQVLENEFGGMNEVLVNLFSLTGNDTHAECAGWFDKPSFLAPLLEGRDPMPGLHANTHLAQVQGFAARYEVLGDQRGLAATARFFGLMLQHHTFSTGGSNWYEHWGDEDRLGDALTDVGSSSMTEESCTQYNILKIARYLFRFTGQPALADFYERAIFNDVIGIQKMPHSHQFGHAHGHDHSMHSTHSMPSSSVPHSHTAHLASVHSSLDAPTSTAGTGSDARAGPAGSRDGDSAAGGLLPGLSIESSDGEEVEEALSAGVQAQTAQQRRRLQRSLARRWNAADLPAAAPAGQDWRQQLLRQAQLAGPSSGQASEYGDGPSPVSPGQFIYYLPLGTGMDKVSKGGWTHGFGTPFNSFWCCYGTAIESFSKIADSIYFKQMPPAPPPDASGSRHPTGNAAAAAAGGAAGPENSSASDDWLPQLYVNQLVSSSVRWRELRVVAHQEAELYGPETAAVARLTLDIYPFDSQAAAAGTRAASGGAWEEPAGGTGASDAVGKERRRFVLNWRIPGWARASEVVLRVNGRNVTSCTPGSAEDKEQGGAWGLSSGASYCPLVREWASGDVVEAFMPMRIRAETLQDSRPEMQALKAVMMGPFLMAGLTHDTNNLTADPAHVDQAVSLPPDPTTLLSIALHPGSSKNSYGGNGEGPNGGAGAASTPEVATGGEGASPPAPPPPPPPLLRHCRGEVRVGAGCAALGAGASPLDATFRLVAPLAGCQAGAAGSAGGAQAAAAGCSVAHARRLLMQPGGSGADPGSAAAAADAQLHAGIEGPGFAPPGGRQLASFESASMPGHFLTIDPSTGRLVLRQGPKAGRSSSGSSGSGAGAEAALAVTQTFRVHISDGAEGGGGGASSSGTAGPPMFALEPLSQPGSFFAVDAGHGELRAAAEAAPHSGAALFSLAPPAAPAYPRGTRVLHGDNRDFLLVPIGQIMDESYTAYFHFTPTP